MLAQQQDNKVPPPTNKKKKGKDYLSQVWVDKASFLWTKNWQDFFSWLLKDIIGV